MSLSCVSVASSGALFCFVELPTVKHVLAGPPLLCNLLASNELTLSTGTLSPTTRHLVAALRLLATLHTYPRLKRGWGVPAPPRCAGGDQRQRERRGQVHAHPDLAAWVHRGHRPE